MSWSQTYSHALLYAVDTFGAVAFFNRPGGVTISSLARIVHLASEDAGYNGVWKARVASLKLWGWQQRFLLWLEPRLGEAHCEGARMADIFRAHGVMDLLGGLDPKNAQ